MHYFVYLCCTDLPLDFGSREDFEEFTAVFLQLHLVLLQEVYIRMYICMHIRTICVCRHGFYG